MRLRCRTVALVTIAVASAWLMGCDRSPPSAEDFKPPETSAPETAQAPVAEQADSSGPVIVEPEEPEPPPQPKPEAPTPPAAPVAEEVVAEELGPAEPEIYGTWYLVRNIDASGDSHWTPESGSYAWTFRRDGTFLVEVSWPEGTESTSGTFELDGNTFAYAAARPGGDETGTAEWEIDDAGLLHLRARGGEQILKR